ncbi:MAG: ABC transporter permease [Bacteroidetes bacterium]|nr:ABC transporter permease [Bacteroidota bacterium]
MLSNYLKTALRFLLRNRTFSLINILGLAAGTLCCLYIVLFVTDQFSYDKQHDRVDEIYRVTTRGTVSGGSPFLTAYCSPPIAPTMKKDFAAVQQFTRVLDMNGFGAKQHLLRYKDSYFYETQAAYADSTFFDVFRFHFVAGNPKTALYEPYTVALLRPVAEKLFGREDPVGKIISIDNAFGKHDFTVAGVFDESLGKSHLQYNILISMNSGGMGDFIRSSEAWATNSMTSSYVRLTPGADAAALQKQLPAFMDKYGAEQLKRYGMTKQLLLQPVRSIHTSAGYNHDDHTVSSSFLWLLMAIAALIQVIACINFMNLSTARAARRAKEVGVRKVIGAGRGNLIRQFLGESFLLCLLAVIIALPLLLLALPWLNQITASDIRPQLLLDYRIGLLLLGLVLVTGFVAGSYPAFYLSAFQAIRVIKGNFTSRVSASGVRRGLVVFQFVLSITLIAAIIVIYSQLNYIKNKDLGFEQDQKLIFTFSTNDVRKQVPAFASELRGLAGVKTASMANNHLGWSVPNSWVYYANGHDPSSGQDIKQIYCDENFAKANGIRLLKGRDFAPSDSAKVLLNETAVRKLGLNMESAVGTRIFSQQDPGEKPAWLEVAGVIKDFNFSSLHEEMGSFMLRFADSTVRQWTDIRSDLTVNASTGDYKTLLGQMQTLWGRHFPGTPFEYTFMDDIVQRQYATEQIMSRIINSFTLMAIVISCLGLFGLAAFSAEQRSKEVAIRKVLGASIGGLAGLLSKEFLKLVAIALLIAIPIGWWMMQRWLEGFAYRITLSWWMFALAGALAVLIALLTVSFQAIRAATANPVKSLRSE